MFYSTKAWAGHSQLSAPSTTSLLARFQALFVENNFVFSVPVLARWTAMIGVQAKVKIKRKVGGRERKVQRGEERIPDQQLEWIY